MAIIFVNKFLLLFLFRHFHFKFIFSLIYDQEPRLAQAKKNINAWKLQLFQHNTNWLITISIENITGLISELDSLQK